MVRKFKFPILIRKGKPLRTILGPLDACGLMYVFDAFLLNSHFMLPISNLAFTALHFSISLICKFFLHFYISYFLVIDLNSGISRPSTVNLQCLLKLAGYYIYQTKRHQLSNVFWFRKLSNNIYNYFELFACTKYYKNRVK